MTRRKRSPEENERRAKIRELLLSSNISSMEDVQDLFIAIFKNKAYIHKNETNPRSLFELPLEMHIELHEGESQQFWL